MEDPTDEEGISLATDEGEHEGFDDGELAEAESRAVACLRVASFAVWLVAAMGVSCLVHRTSVRVETARFDAAFRDASGRLMGAFADSIGRTLGGLDGLALDFQSYAELTGSQWPFVTLTGFQRRAGSARDLSRAELIMLLPLVKGGAEQSRWEAYSVQNQAWLHEREPLEQTSPFSEHHSAAVVERDLEQNQISHFIFNESGRCVGEGPFAPIWETYPVVPAVPDWINFDLLSVPEMRSGIQVTYERRLAVMGETMGLQNASSVPSFVDHWLDELAMYQEDNASSWSPLGPVSPMVYPILNDTTVDAVLVALGSWCRRFSNILPATVQGLVVVLENGCGQRMTYHVNGPVAQYEGEGDLHDPRFDFMVISSSLDSYMNETNHQRESFDQLNRDYCPYTLSFYPSEVMRQSFSSWTPLLNTLAVGMFFVIGALVFVWYDATVERRQKIVMDKALQSTAIVSSLFPETVRDRLFRRCSLSEDHGGDDGSLTVLDEAVASSDPMSSMIVSVQPNKMRLKSFLNNVDDGGASAAKPIADLFPSCTVLFADISGFTAWSSIRDPAQVFMLLESVYSVFDKIARKRGVFKVETIGDSYVAVTGLPEPQPDHAVIMTRFARDCKIKMGEVTRKLEMTLGPGTQDLSMRFGLHSGPVTAGVLRGEKSRFQLFGDTVMSKITVNTAARMESTGMRDKIQVSQATADELIHAGRGHWLVKREETVVAKGKGEMQTYWINDAVSRRGSVGESSRCSMSSVSSEHASVIWGSDDEVPEVVSQRSRHQSLVDYNVDLLAMRLKHVIARRRALAMAGRRCSQGGRPTNVESYRECKIEHGSVLEEVTEVIKLPSFNARACKGYVDPESIELDPLVVSQLRRFVTIIAAMYRNNPFHNFEHASHVTMSVNKLLQRVVAPELTFKRRSLQMDGNSLKKQIASDLHNYTYGITSDPLTQFGIVFAALIHDCDHWGVSNAQLVKEGVPIAEKYKHKSVAEQNSVDLAWDLLMDEEEFGALQQCIFPTEAEIKRFRQVVVNVVMATDIFDHELCEMRNNRWAKAFRERDPGSPPDDDDENRKATIVIEHIMQASDVSHAMQHWKVYQKWNRRLFDELFTAYKADRMDRDPSDFWYESELKFFDSYIIPLAKKLKDCGVFGVSGDECLNYATDNRREWESKGRMIVGELVANYQQREREEAEARAAAAAANAGSPAKKSKRGRMARRRSLFTNGG